MAVVSDPYRLHQFVYQQFVLAEADVRLLYRLEMPSLNGERAPSLLVQTSSPLGPSWVARETDWFRIRTKVVTVSLSKRDYYFRIRANPVRSLPSPGDGQRGKRIGLYREEDQRHWMKEQLNKCGMRPIQMEIQKEPRMEFKKGKPGQGKRVMLARALFDGVLTVDAPPRAEAALREGIGPAKGFGFGLLSLAKL